MCQGFQGLESFSGRKFSSLILLIDCFFLEPILLTSNDEMISSESVDQTWHVAHRESVKLQWRLK